MQISNADRSLTAHLKAQAARMGFDLVGVTSAEPPAHLEVYHAWLEAGRHGEMAYLASDEARLRRAQPRRILPECRSILVVARNYLPRRKVTLRGGGRIATYAAGEDYHFVLVERLERLVAWLRAEAGRGFSHRIYCDTGPVLERELAQRAGLGWIGKNTCLINPQIGSYTFLAAVLLELPLQADNPFQDDRCGSCQRCLVACPTQCILPDRTLDARRCISYLTIELRAAIPPHLRSWLDDWLFGCDICQEVCPWNVRFAQPTRDPAFQPMPLLDSLSLPDCLGLSRSGAVTAPRMSPLRRAKAVGLARNAAVVMGNSKDRSNLPALRLALQEDRESLVRLHAAWALGQLGGRAARSALKQALSTEKDEETLSAIQAALQGE